MRPTLFMLSLLIALMTAVSSLEAGQEAARPSASTKPAPAAVNLNTATVDQLASLPGIGERTAQLIVEYRQKNGPFKKAEDLMNVKGIGEKSFLRLKNLLTVTPPKTDRSASQGL
jgi:competence protein ComEA